MNMKSKHGAPEEISEIKAELLALTGSTANYNALLDDIREQLRAFAQDGRRVLMKGDKVLGISVPKSKPTVRVRSQAR